MAKGLAILHHVELSLVTKEGSLNEIYVRIAGDFKEPSSMLSLACCSKKKKKKKNPYLVPEIKSSSD